MSCAKNDGQEQFMFREDFSSTCLCVKLSMSLGFPFAVGEQTNPELLSVTHCVRDEFQSIPLFHRIVMFSEVYFHIQLLMIQCLESQQAVLVHFTLSHGGWPWGRINIKLVFTEYTCNSQQQAGLCFAWKQLQISNLPVESGEKNPTCRIAKQFLEVVMEAKQPQSNNLHVTPEKNWSPPRNKVSNAWVGWSNLYNSVPLTQHCKPHLLKIILQLHVSKCCMFTGKTSVHLCSSYSVWALN